MKQRLNAMSINDLIDALERVKNDYSVQGDKPTTILVDEKSVFICGLDGLSICIANIDA